MEDVCEILITDRQTHVSIRTDAVERSPVGNHLRISLDLLFFRVRRTSLHSPPAA
jgi:hypothetical protein